jgi:hypothetical protein
VLKAHRSLTIGVSGRPELERAVANELRRRGHYDDSPDAVEWMTREAADVVRAISEAPSTAAAAVRAVLVNTGLHDPTDPAEAACLDDDVDALVDVVEQADNRSPGDRPHPPGANRSEPDRA